MKKSYLGILLAGVLTGCLEPDGESNAKHSESAAIPQITSLADCQRQTGCKLLRVNEGTGGTGDLVAYDLTRKQAAVALLPGPARNKPPVPTFVSKQNLERVEKGNDSYYTYYFTDPRIRCFTGGDTINLAEQIFCQEGENYRVIYSLENKLALMPLAASGERMLFHLYDNSYIIGRQEAIVEWDPQQKELLPLSRATVQPGEVLLRGAIVKNTLYYTGCAPGQEQTTVYQLDLNNPESEPGLVQSGLPGCPMLHSDGQQLYIDDRENLTPLGGGKSFPSQEANYFDSLTHTLIQVDLYPNGPQDQPWSIGGAIRIKEDGTDPQVEGSPYGDLIVTDTKTGEVIATVPDQYGFEFEGNELVVYAAGSIERIALD